VSDERFTLAEKAVEDELRALDVRNGISKASDTCDRKWKSRELELSNYTDPGSNPLLTLCLISQFNQGESDFHPILNFQNLSLICPIELGDKPQS
jgi:hypothetical protein